MIVKESTDSTIIVPGKMPMEQFNNLMQTQMPQEEFDTIGGFVLHLFGKLPAKGEEVSYEGYNFLIENVGRARILKIRVSSQNGKGSRSREMNAYLIIAIIFICLILEALYSGGEIALIASDINRMKFLATRGSFSAQQAVKLMEKPEWFISTTLIGTNLAIIAGSTLATGLLIGAFGPGAW